MSASMDHESPKASEPVTAAADTSLPSPSSSSSSSSLSTAISQPFWPGRTPSPETRARARQNRNDGDDGDDESSAGSSEQSERKYMIVLTQRNRLTPNPDTIWHKITAIITGLVSANDSAAAEYLAQYLHDDEKATEELHQCRQEPGRMFECDFDGHGIWARVRVEEHRGSFATGFEWAENGSEDEDGDERSEETADENDEEEEEEEEEEEDYIFRVYGL